MPAGILMINMMMMVMVVMMMMMMMMMMMAVMQCVTNTILSSEYEYEYIRVDFFWRI